MELGYIRVSSIDQNENRQLKKIKELGIEERFIFIDKITDSTFEREQYISMKKIIREGDLIHIDALDRLGRDYDGVKREWKYITRDLGADMVVLENKELFDSRKFRDMGDIGKLLEDQFLSMLSYVADQERKKIRQRQKEGIEVARASGVTFGRPKIKIDDKFNKVYDKWKNENITVKEAIGELNVSRSTFYRRIREYEG